MPNFNRARSLYIAQMLATEIRTGRKVKGARTMMQAANDLMGGSKHRTKHAALSALVAEMTGTFGYVPTVAVRRAVKA